MLTFNNRNHFQNLISNPVFNLVKNSNYTSSNRRNQIQNSFNQGDHFRHLKGLENPKFLSIAHFFLSLSLSPSNQKQLNNKNGDNVEKDKTSEEVFDSKGKGRGPQRRQSRCNEYNQTFVGSKMMLWLSWSLGFSVPHQ